MKVSRWGNSLAVRLSREVVAALDLKEGDDIVLRVGSEGAIEVGRDDRHRAALSRMDALSRPLPSGFTFDRGEIYDRAGADAAGRRT